MPTIVDALKEKLKVTGGQTIAEVLSAASDIKSDVIADTIPGLKGSGGGSGFSGNDVVFYDYDGSVVASYSADDFKALSAFPENPVHEGLTAQGWNWDFDKAKAYVNKYGSLNIGQMYITNDEKTRFYINLISRTKSGSVDSTVHVTFSASSIGSVTIDWGDGNSETNTATESTTYDHTYNADGDYVITFDVSDGEIVFEGAGGEDPFFEPDRLINVFFGSGVSSIADYAFTNCSALSEITIPDSVTSIGDFAFTSCDALSEITIPDSVTSIPESAFQNCSALPKVALPDSVTSIGIAAFSGCSALSEITIPDSVTSIGDFAFSNCSALSEIIIPDSVTSIGENAFEYCYALPKITIPDSVTDIGENAFVSSSLRNVVMTAAVPPTLGGGDVFSLSSYAYQIIVPYSADHSVLAAYKTAEGWSTYADHIVEADPE